MASKIPKYKLKSEALTRIIDLFKQAELRKNLSSRYVEIARKIGMKANQPIPKDLKKKFCKHCNSYFQNGNFRVRTRNKLLVYTCLQCNKQTRYGIKLNK